MAASSEGLSQRSRRFLFSVAGGYGHIHPVIPLASALVARGHEVAFAVGPFLRPVAEAAGFTVLQVGGDLAGALASDPEYESFKKYWATLPPGLETEMLVYKKLWCGITSRVRTPQLVEICREWQPDMVIREAGEYSSAIAAEHLGLPHATISFAASLKGLAMFEHGAAEQLDPVRESWGLPPDPTLEALRRYLYLAYSPPTFATQDVELQPGAAAPAATGPLPPTTHYLCPDFFDQAEGETLPEWVEQLRENGQPTIYATLGTEANREPGVYPRVLQAIIEGVRDLPVNLVVTLGRDKDPADFGPQPSNVRIEGYIAQSLLLPLCSLTIMHGGSNSLLQAVDVGLPLVVTPLIADQFFNAAVTQTLRLGQVVQTWHEGQPGNLDFEQLTPSGVNAAVAEVLNNPAYEQSVDRLRSEMHALPGQDHAVELVERVAATGEPVLVDNG